MSKQSICSVFDKLRSEVLKSELSDSFKIIFAIVKFILYTNTLNTQ